jgi:hypothetical protein
MKRVLGLGLIFVMGTSALSPSDRSGSEVSHSDGSAADSPSQNYTAGQRSGPKRKRTTADEEIAYQSGDEGVVLKERLRGRGKGRGRRVRHQLPAVAEESEDRSPVVRPAQLTRCEGAFDVRLTLGEGSPYTPTTSLGLNPLVRQQSSGPSSCPSTQPYDADAGEVSPAAMRSPSHSNHSGSAGSDEMDVEGSEEEDVENLEAAAEELSQATASESEGSTTSGSSSDSDDEADSLKRIRRAHRSLEKVIDAGMQDLSQDKQQELLDARDALSIILGINNETSDSEEDEVRVLVVGRTQAPAKSDVKLSEAPVHTAGRWARTKSACSRGRNWCSRSASTVASYLFTRRAAAVAAISVLVARLAQVDPDLASIRPW